MVDGVGKAGGIVGIVGAIMTIVLFSFTFLLLGLVITMSQYSDEILVFYDSDFISTMTVFVMVCVIIYSLFILQVITLSLTIKFLKTGRHKIAAGVLNILTLSIIGIVAGVLILVHDGEEKDEFNYTDYVEAE